MEPLIHYLFLNNWQRKLMALVTAIIIWFFVSHTITEVKTIRNVPIRICNLPTEKTIIGLLPNGILSKRISLTLTGAKDVIDDIERGDVEVNIDASSIDRNDWIVQITKKNLVSLNPEIDLANNITNVEYPEFVIKMNRLVTEKVPLEILPPIGTAPQGYEFLDLWPQKLMQTVTGPEEEVYRLKNEGLSIAFNLSEISKSDLDALKSHQLSGDNNEVSFPIPMKWKQVPIPYRKGAFEEINDPEAGTLRIAFLSQEFLPINQLIPVNVFFPAQTLSELNSNLIQLSDASPIINKNNTTLFSKKLYVKNVSVLFLDIIRDYLEIQIVVQSNSENEKLPWALNVVTPQSLEESYLTAHMMAHTKQQGNSVKKREVLYRKRFREYLHRLSLYISQDHKLDIESTLQDDKIVINEY